MDMQRNIKCNEKSTVPNGNMYTSIVVIFFSFYLVSFIITINMLKINKINHQNHIRFYLVSSKRRQHPRK